MRTVSNQLDPMRMVEVLIQVYKSPGQLVASEVKLVFSSALPITERNTDDHPQGWEGRNEQWEIDNFLGMYEPEQKQITIFDSAIDFVSDQIGIKNKQLEYVVRLHEWSHAAFHLAVTQDQSCALTKSDLDGNRESIDAKFMELSNSYSSVETYVHEQLAQVLTYLALNRLLDEATLEEARKSCKSLINIFHCLMKRQPHRYQLENNLLQLGQQVLGRRLNSIILLLRTGKVAGDQETWDTIMSW